MMCYIMLPNKQKQRYTFSKSTSIRRGILFLLIAVMTFTNNSLVHAVNMEFMSQIDARWYNDEGKNCSTSTTGGTDGTGATSTADLKEFVKKYISMAVEVNKKYGLPYEAILAQGSIESAYGRSGLTVNANNFFGIKAGGNWSGDVVNMSTEEEVGGGRTTIVDGFRKYPTVEAGWLDYGEFITKNSRYKEALKYPGDPRKYIQEIKNAGYATASEYVEINIKQIASIEQIVKEENLSPPSSEIKVEGGGSASTSGASGSNGCTSSGIAGASASKIVEKAKSLAWEDGRTVGDGSEKPEYREARSQYNPGGGSNTDCGRFVATVMRASGADPDYPPVGTSVQYPYLESKTDKYYTKKSPAATDLQPGDILIFNGHTLIYTGDIGNGFTMTQASLGDHVPSYRTQSTVEWMLGQSGVMLARLK